MLPSVLAATSTCLPAGPVTAGESKKVAWERACQICPPVVALSA